jgi:hypothetical protein
MLVGWREEDGSRQLAERGKYYLLGLAGVIPQAGLKNSVTL